MSKISYILDITWGPSSLPEMPRLVGPFVEHHEAEEFAAVNIPDGSFEVRPVHYPYASPEPHVSEEADR